MISAPRAKTMASGLFGLLAFALFACAHPPQSDVIAIEHVTVLTMAPDATPLRNYTVLLSGDRITAVGPASEINAPRGATRIDGAGKFLLPGFTDMHTHPESAGILAGVSGAQVPAGAVSTADVFLPFIANGVTQVLSAGGTEETLAQRDEIARGAVLGPHLFVSALVDGSPPLWPPEFSHPVANPEEARARVRELRGKGFDFIKTYSALNPESFAAIVDEVNAAGGRTIGHIPGRRQNQTERYLIPGFALAMHAEEFAFQAPSIAQSTEQIPHYVELAKRNGTGLVATLVADERILEQMRDPSSLRAQSAFAYVNPYAHPFWFERSPYGNSSPERVAMVAEIVAFNRKLVKAFADAGVPVYAGTDAFLPGIVSGFSLHDEFEHLVAAGMTPEQVLFSATRGASEWLGVGDDRGSIAAGKRADLVLLSADPLADIRNTRSIEAVIVNGHVLPRSELDAAMADLARRNAEAASQMD